MADRETTESCHNNDIPGDFEDCINPLDFRLDLDCTENLDTSRTDELFGCVDIEKLFQDTDFVQSCYECNMSYSDVNPPFAISCGHSVCLNCKETFEKTSFMCSKCVAIFPSLEDEDFVLNKSLLHQIKRVKKDPRIINGIEMRSKEKKSDPLIKLLQAAHSKCVQLVYLQYCMIEIGKAFKDGSQLKGVLQFYKDSVKEFNENREKTDIKTSLKQLVDSIEKIEESFEKLLKTEEMQNSISVKDKFFDRFKIVHMYYKYEKVVYALVDDINVYAIIEDEDKVFYAKFYYYEMGIHIFSFQPEVPSHGIKFSYSEFLRSEKVTSLKALFIEFEEKEKKSVRKIYINVENSSYTEGASTLFTRSHLGICLSGFQFNSQKGLLTTYIASRYYKTIVGFFPLKNAVSKKEEEGLLYFDVQRNQSISVHIILNKNSKNPRNISNVIGSVTSGLSFLRSGETFIAKQTGIVLPVRELLESVV